MASKHGPDSRGLLAIVLMAVFLNEAAPEWFSHGGDITNQRNAKDEVIISPRSVRNLRLKWQFFAGKDISATPAVADGIVYFPSWNGHIYAVKALSGELVWDKNIGELTGLGGGPRSNISVSRSTPIVARDKLIVGITGPAYVIALCRLSGQLLWSTQLDPRPLAIITQSGTFYDGAVYIGVSSLEGTLPASECCTFRGSLAKLDAQTGGILWQTYTIPDNGGNLGGYSGAPIWGSSPSIDIKRRHVYVGTGQLYDAPADVLQCQEEQNNHPNSSQPDQCVGPDVHFDSILAFDIDTGNITWFRQLGGYDVFVFACLFPGNPDCPPGPNLDADFGEAPMLLTINSTNNTKRDIVVAVQKSGFAWALDRDNGEIVWFKLAGPGGFGGGGIWGSATDGERVYTNIANSNNFFFTLTPSTNTTNGGGWVALDSNSGQILWSTANPDPVDCDGPVTVANGVIFGGSVAPNGPFYAMDAKTGEILWSYNTGATIYGGAAVSYGCVYVGSGYNVRAGYTAGTSLFAFCII